MSQVAKAGVALLCGSIVLYGLIALCIAFSETQEEKLLLFLMLWTIPLSILTTCLVAKMLRFDPGNSFLKDS